MDKKIDIENLLYYKYLIDLKFDNIKKKIFDENLNKKVDNFEYLINKSIDNNLPSQIDKFKKIYNVLKEYNNNYKTFNIKKKDDNEYIKNYFDVIKNISITIEEIINTNLPKQKQLQHAQQLYKEINQKQQRQQQRQQQQQQQQQQQPNLVLINAVGDGECFINAIFDYGLYTNKIDKIYEKLIYLHNYIYKNHLIYEERYTFIINMLYMKKYFYRIDDFDEKPYNKIKLDSIFKEDIPSNFNINNNILIYLTHKDLNSRRKSIYDNQRIYFVNYMKYIFALYCYTIYYNEFLKTIKNLMRLYNEDTNNTYDDIYSPKIIELLNKYNETKNNDTSLLLIEYINIYSNHKPNDPKLYTHHFFEKNNEIESTDIEINIFKKILSEKIDINDYTKPFNITIDNLTNIPADYKEKQNYRNEISLILQDNNHYLLCLNYEELII